MLLLFPWSPGLCVSVCYRLRLVLPALTLSGVQTAASWGLVQTQHVVSQIRNKLPVSAASRFLSRCSWSDTSLQSSTARRVASPGFTIVKVNYSQPPRKKLLHYWCAAALKQSVHVMSQCAWAAFLLGSFKDFMSYSCTKIVPVLPLLLRVVVILLQPVFLMLHRLCCCSFHHFLLL